MRRNRRFVSGLAKNCRDDRKYGFPCGLHSRTDERGGPRSTTTEGMKGLGERSGPGGSSTGLTYRGRPPQTNGAVVRPGGDPVAARVEGDPVDALRYGR